MKKLVDVLPNVGGFSGKWIPFRTKKCPFLQASSHVSPVEAWGHGKKDEWDLVENTISP